MTDQIGYAALLEAALQVAAEGLARAKEDGDESAAMAYYEVLNSAYELAESLQVPMPNDQLAKLDPDELMGMNRRAA